MRILRRGRLRTLALLWTLGLSVGLGAIGGIIALEGAGFQTPLQQITDDNDKRFHGVDHSSIQVAPEKAPSNPDAGLSDRQRVERIEQAKLTQQQFLADFAAQSSDARSLPRVTIEDNAASPSSLRESIERATMIVVGTVKSVEYRPSDQMGPMTSTATVSVSKVLKGPIETAEITVSQVGGPIPTAGGPALMQTASNEVLLPGDEVMLMLVEALDAISQSPAQASCSSQMGKPDSRQGVRWGKRLLTEVRTLWFVRWNMR